MSRETPANETRRSFLTSAAAVAAGGTVAAAPVAVGVAAFLSPLGKSNAVAKVRVALLDQVPDDGQPRFFPVVADRIDAWTRYDSQRIGAVYLVREPGAAAPLALTAKCPHAGCFVGYKAGDDHFKCPCHTSAFKKDGSRVQGDAEVSPRDMDRLPVELRKAQTADGAEVAEVWIEFVDFQTGRKEQVRAS